MARSILNRPVLVLNKTFFPIQKVDVMRAITMIYQGKAMAVDHIDPHSYERFTWEDWTRIKPQDDHLIIRTAGGKVLCPEVIYLIDQDAVPRRGVTCSRINILKRDRFTCQYCGAQPGRAELSQDHVIPKSQGGKFCWDNIATACVECNQRKADRTPKQAGMKLRKQPCRPDWQPLYASAEVPIRSWSKFVSELYWLIPLQED